MTRQLALVAAVARNGVIGKSGGMPWHIPEDLKHFRSVTLGHAVVMGRKTYESIGRPLPKRLNHVVSSAVRPAEPLSGDAPYTSLHWWPTLSQAVHAAWVQDPEPRVIGGGHVYAQAILYATALYLTELDMDAEGDVNFPAFDRAGWREVSSRAGETEGVVFREYRR
jgi:dihydrofolate reductase